MRKPGYYWVMYKEIWIVAEWFQFSNVDRCMFFIPGEEDGIYEASMDAIDERKIEREDE